MKKFYSLFLFLIFKEFCLNSPSKEYLELVNWITKNGGYISPKLYPIENDKSNRYIIAKEKIYKNEKIIIIPDSIMLSSMNILMYNICRDAYALEREIFDFECLVYFITLDLNNKKSFFSPYYNYFPKIIKKDYFLYLPEEIKIKLSKSELGEKIRIGEKFFQKSLSPVKKIIKSQNLMDTFIESFILVSSRNFGRRGSYFEEVNSMVPYIDLLNHGNNYNVWFIFNDLKNIMTVFAIKDIEKGNEIINFYGKENNIALYSYYGFVIKDNIYHVTIHILVSGQSFTFSFNSSNDKDVLQKLDKIANKEKCNIKDAANILFNKLIEKKTYYESIKTDFDNINYIINEEKYIIEMYIDILKKYI